MRFPLLACFTVLVSVSVGYAANLASDASFETLNAGSWSMHGWFVDGSAKGTVTRTSPGFHGEAAARITADSPVAPNVFIRFGQRLAVRPDTDYVISLYVRSEGVGYALSGGGPDWALRTQIPRGPANALEVRDPGWLNAEHFDFMALLGSCAASPSPHTSWSRAGT